MNIVNVKTSLVELNNYIRWMWSGCIRKENQVKGISRTSHSDERYTANHYAPLRKANPIDGNQLSCGINRLHITSEDYTDSPRLPLP